MPDPKNRNTEMEKISYTQGVSSMNCPTTHAYTLAALIFILVAILATGVFIYKGNQPGFWDNRTVADREVRRQKHLPPDQAARLTCTTTAGVRAKVERGIRPISSSELDRLTRKERIDYLISTCHK